MKFQTMIQLEAKPTVFIVDKYTPPGIVDLIVGLRSADLACFVHDLKGDLIVNPGSIKPLIVEPGVSSSIVVFPESIRVSIRTNEIVNPNGTVGYLPDIIYKKKKGANMIEDLPEGVKSFGDPVVQVCTAWRLRDFFCNLFLALNRTHL